MASAERLTGPQLRLLVLLSVATFFEGYDFLALSQILVNLSDDLGLSKADVSGMVDQLRSVLVLDEKGRLRSIHATFEEFLADEKRCVDQLYHVNRAQGQSRLVSACLEMFSFDSQCLAHSCSQ